MTGRILLALAAVFFLAAVVRSSRGSFKLDGASRTWFIISLIFGGVAAWLLVT